MMNFKSLQNYEIFWTIRWQRSAQAAIACKNHVLIHFLFMSVGGVSAANPPVTIHLKNVTVAELLRQIEAQGKYSFAYNNADIDLTRVVSVAAEAWPIERIVLKCIPDVLVNVERNKVILTPRRGAQVSPQNFGQRSRTLPVIPS